VLQPGNRTTQRSGCPAALPSSGPNASWPRMSIPSCARPVMWLPS